MKRTNVLIAAVITAVMIGVYLVGYKTGEREPQVPQINTAAQEEEMIDRINLIRFNKEVPSLKSDPGLNNTAKLKVKDMIERRYWSHETPDGKPYYFLIAQNRPGLSIVGENLARCFESTDAMIEGWIKSEGHLANIIKPEYTLYGTYTEWDAHTRCLVTVNHFGREL